MEETIGQVPGLLIFNKSDLIEEWEIDKRDIEDLTAKGWDVLLTSAKTGSGVEKAFRSLARKLLNA